MTIKWEPIQDAEGRQGFFWEEASWIVFRMSDKEWWLAFQTLDIHSRYGPYGSAEKAQEWAERLQKETEEIDAKKLLH